MKTSPCLLHPLALVENYTMMVIDLEAQYAEALEQALEQSLEQSLKIPYAQSHDAKLSAHLDRAFYIGIDLNFAKRELENAIRLVNRGVQGVYVKHMSSAMEIEE